MTDEEYKEYEDLERKLFKKGGGSIQYEWPIPENCDPDLKEYLRLNRKYNCEILYYKFEHGLITVRDLIENG